MQKAEAPAKQTAVIMCDNNGNKQTQASNNSVYGSTNSEGNTKHACTK